MAFLPQGHDEPLRGVLAGKRSIRLSWGYRALNVVDGDVVEYAIVEDVNKHYGA